VLDGITYTLLYFGVNFYLQFQDRKGQKKRIQTIRNLCMRRINCGLLDLTLKVRNILIAGFISPIWGHSMSRGYVAAHIDTVPYFAQDIGLQSGGTEATQFVRDSRVSVLLVHCYHITTLSLL
jgi:hypothetical protein